MILAAEWSGPRTVSVAVETLEELDAFELVQPPIPVRLRGGKQVWGAVVLSPRNANQIEPGLPSLGELLEQEGGSNERSA